MNAFAWWSFLLELLFNLVMWTGCSSDAIKIARWKWDFNFKSSFCLHTVLSPFKKKMVCQSPALSLSSVRVQSRGWGGGSCAWWLGLVRFWQRRKESDWLGCHCWPREMSPSTCLLCIPARSWPCSNCDSWVGCWALVQQGPCLAVNDTLAGLD